MSAEASVLLDVRDGVALATLNEAAHMNALSNSLLDGLMGVVARVREDTAIRALVLTANGRAFSAGADLADFERCLAAGQASLGAHVGELMQRRGNPVIHALHTLPVPVVCAVNGVAAGGGVGLALAGDMVVAARSAYFYLPFVPALGAVPDMGSSWALPRAVGRARALGLALTGHKLGAEQAAAWGLIWACVDDADLPAQALALARQLAQVAPEAVLEARALFAASEHNDLQAQLAQEHARQQRLAGGPAFAEGVRAFLARRKPVFAGR